MSPPRKLRQVKKALADKGIRDVTAELPELPALKQADCILLRWPLTKHAEGTFEEVMAAIEDSVDAESLRQACRKSGILVPKSATMPG